MSYPYPVLLSLLQYHCTPAQYKRLVDWREISLLGIKPDNDYWKVLPRITYAHCPICGAQYQELADPYSFDGWTNNAPDRLDEELYLPPNGPAVTGRCAHFMGIHKFVNLHGVKPTEVNYFHSFNGEVPYITETFLIENTYAILHTIPICRIEADKFVPRYSVFLLSYFSQNPSLARANFFKAKGDFGKDDPEYYPTQVDPPWGDGIKYDLTHWAAKGKLGWLDVTQPDLPLRLGSNANFPEMYKSIEGSRRVYTWDRGKMSVRPF